MKSTDDKLTQKLYVLLLNLNDRLVIALDKAWLSQPNSQARETYCHKYFCSCHHRLLHFWGSGQPMRNWERSTGMYVYVELYCVISQKPLNAHVSNYYYYYKSTDLSDTLQDACCWGTLQTTKVQCAYQ